MARQFKILQRKDMFKNKWIRLEECETEVDGVRGLYSIVHRADSVVTIVRDSSDNFLLLKQYRFPTESHSWEFPMGGRDANEDTRMAAARELFEETGISASHLIPLGSFRPIPGLTPQTVDVFEVPVDEIKITNTNSDEIVTRSVVSREQLIRMVASGQITDGFTLCSFALYVANKKG